MSCTYLTIDERKVLIAFCKSQIGMHDERDFHDAHSAEEHLRTMKKILGKLQKC
jgi:hypothetical protein